MKMKKIDHIGWAVKSLAEGKEVLSQLGLDLQKEEEVKEQGVKVAIFPLGEFRLELLEPTGEGAISRFLEKKGEGIHHLAFAVENLEEALKELEKKGFLLIDRVPRLGAERKRIAFLHPQSTQGVLIELVEEG